MRLVDVDALHQLIHRVCGDRSPLDVVTSYLGGIDLSGEIRDVLESRAVVPAVLHVVVLQRAADVLHRSIRLNGGEDLPIAQLIAEDHRHAAGEAGAERSARRPRRGCGWPIASSENDEWKGSTAKSLPLGKAAGGVGEIPRDETARDLRRRKLRAVPRDRRRRTGVPTVCDASNPRISLP